MKFYIEKVTPRLYFVVDDEGKRFSKKPMYKRKAREQQKALYASQDDRRMAKVGKRRIRGGAEGDMVMLDPQLPAQESPEAQPPEPILTPAQQRAVALGKTLQAQQEQFSEAQMSSIYGQYPEPYVPPKDMNARGLPWYLAQHPNEYSANPNQVMLYRNEGQFLRSPIYQKYKDDIQLYQERAGYGTRFAQIIPGKPFRIVFRSKSFDDNNQYILDLDDADAFMDFIDQAKDSNILTPVEFLSAQFMAKNKAAMSKLADDNAEAYKIAYNQGLSDQLDADQRAQEAAQQSQGDDDESGFSGALGAVSGVVSNVFDFL